MVTTKRGIDNINVDLQKINNEEVASLMVDRGLWRRVVTEVKAHTRL